MKLNPRVLIHLKIQIKAKLLIRNSSQPLPHIIHGLAFLINADWKLNLDESSII